jgi:hypothetical protein
MSKNARENLYAFPAVQEYESVEHALQSLAALRRHLSEPARASFERHIRRLQKHLPLYKRVNHLTPIEFVLLALMIEILEGKDNPRWPDHPPFP